MTDPNRNALWGRAIVEELVAAGVTDAVVCPGSRSTPLTYALATHDAVTVHSHLDERSGAFYALGRGKRTGEPTAVVTTSGTAAANLLPAVVEAHQSRAPLLVLTADRPPERHDSGANQTIDQTRLYGDRVRWFRDLGEPQPRPRALRSLRTTVARAVATTTGTPAGPVHLNCPFRKPLEPSRVEGDVPDSLSDRDPTAVAGREGPFVEVSPGEPTVDEATARSLAGRLIEAERPLFVAGPADDAPVSPDELVALADRVGAPIVADPLSGVRFGGHIGGRAEGDTPPKRAAPIVGAGDAIVDAVTDWPSPELVVRFGASPTSKPLRHHLRDANYEQVLVDPAGGWREAEFTATGQIVADPTRLVDAVLGSLGDGGRERGTQSAGETPGEESPAGGVEGWIRRFRQAERAQWDLVAEAQGEWFEGGVVGDVFADAPDPSTVVVANSMPVRDADRFAEPRAADVTVLGNRGASGIDGLVSTALGAASAVEESVVLITGDLAYYHDMNGLLALERCDVSATVVLVNNDGGGIFHRLPIAEHDPPFTEQFVTPHGLDFAPTGELYVLEFRRVEDRSAFREAYRDSLARDGTQVIEARTDAVDSHAVRDRLTEELGTRLDQLE